MPCLQVIYRSVAAPGTDAAMVLGIMRESQRRNVEDGISGLLLYRDGRFMQLIEGPEDRVTELLRRIGGDPRHRDMAVTDRYRAEWLAMPAWAMAYVPPAGEILTVAPDAFVLDHADALDICRALPPALGGRFLEVLGEAGAQ